MKTIHNRLLIPLFGLMATLLAACSGDVVTDDTQPLPEGTGNIRITICTPEANPSLTRAVNATPWEDPNNTWEWLHSYRILICNSSNKVVQVLDGSTMSSVESDSYPYKQSAEIISQPLEAGNYNIYALANFADYSNYAVGTTINPDATIKVANGHVYDDSNFIPMSGKLDAAVTVSAGQQADAGTITVWRMVGKLQFEFANNTNGKVVVKGIEVEPINQASGSGPGIYLFSKDDLTSENNLVPLFPSETTKNVTATWSLNTTTLTTTATASINGVFESTQLTCGSKISTADGLLTTSDESLTPQSFKVTENVSSKDDDAVITFKVTPKAGMTFTPKNLSFKACRGGTDGGKFDVEIVNGGSSTTLATEVTPPRYNGDSGNKEPPFYTSYSYPLSGTSITGDYIVNIYLYGLNEKAYAFSDVVISGDVTNNTGSDLQEHLTLPAGALTDVGTVSYEPSSALELAATNGTGNLFFYVNETDATFTTTENQFSVRFKIARQNEEGWYDDEIRFGLTTEHNGTSGGFNVIRRNDWIHIPVVLRDWQFRVEAIPFVPIAGYPAVLFSSDALTATFSTGGYIILQPFAQKNNDGTWRDFSDSEVQFVSMTWTNSDGANVFGDDKIVKTPFTYDSVTKCITGELNQAKVTLGHTNKTAITVTVKLGPSGSQYTYSFTFDVVI